MTPTITMAKTVGACLFEIRNTGEPLQLSWPSSALAHQLDEARARSDSPEVMRPVLKDMPPLLTGKCCCGITDGDRFVAEVMCVSHGRLDTDMRRKTCEVEAGNAIRLEQALEVGVREHACASTPLHDEFVRFRFRSRMELPARLVRFPCPRVGNRTAKPKIRVTNLSRRSDHIAIAIASPTRRMHRRWSRVFFQSTFR